MLITAYALHDILRSKDVWNKNATICLVETHVLVELVIEVFLLFFLDEFLWLVFVALLFFLFTSTKMKPVVLAVLKMSFTVVSEVKH